MTNPTQTLTEGEFVLHLDLGNMPPQEQQGAIIDALRKVAEALEDYPMAEVGQQRGGRRSFDALGVGARWTWQA
jgi:hypothetical protein